MDLEQITKRLEWLDEERRRDKNTIASLEERLGLLENSSTQQLQQVNEISGDVARMQAMETRLMDIDASIGKMRIELGRSIEAIEKQRSERERENERIRLGDVEQLNKNSQEIHQVAEKLDLIKKDITTRKEEENRLVRLVDETKKLVEDNARLDEESRRALKMAEDNRRTDAKRLADLQGEVAALRKRLEEQRGKQDVFSETLRKIDLKTTELQNSDTERKQLQHTFMEKQNLANVERDRLWKDWQTRFDDIDKKSTLLDTQIQSLEATIRAVKRSQELLDEVTQRFERRINEITEMQRLGEDRFRNEWVAFKADDQKRWANYSLDAG